MDTPISTEAVEAAARALYGDDWDQAPADARAFYLDAAERMLAATLPYLPQRVSPSEHVPVRGGSSLSNIPGNYSGDWLICSCDPADTWIGNEYHEARRIPIAEYPAHLFGAAPTVEQVRREVLAPIFALHHPVTVKRATWERFDVFMVCAECGDMGGRYKDGDEIPAMNFTSSRWPCRTARAAEAGESR